MVDYRFYISGKNLSYLVLFSVYLVLYLSDSFLMIRRLRQNFFYMKDKRGYTSVSLFLHIKY